MGTPELCLNKEDMHERIRSLGASQMRVFMDGKGPIWLEIWVGGVAGRVHRVGRSMEYNSFSLAQMLVAKRNDLRRKLEEGGMVEVHNPAKPNGLPMFEYVEPDILDVTILEEQMEGALNSLDGNGDYIARLVLEKALRGETFAKLEKHFSRSFSSNGNGG